MKNKKEVDVDFIGGMGPLTKEEEQKVSAFIKSQKSSKAKRQARSIKISRTKKAA